MKKLLSLCFALILSIGLSTTAFAKTQNVSPYEKVLNSVNAEFNLDLGYVPVDESKVSIEEYERTTRELAIEQRELLDYMSMRQKQSQESSLIQSVDLMSLSTITKTATSDVWGLGTYLNITAAYYVTDTSVSSLRNATLNHTVVAAITGAYATVTSGPTYSVIDGGRTGTVLFRGDMHYSGGVTYTNVSFYTEFYYNS